MTSDHRRESLRRAAEHATASSKVLSWWALVQELEAALAEARAERVRFGVDTSKALDAWNFRYENALMERDALRERAERAELRLASTEGIAALAMATKVELQARIAELERALAEREADARRLDGIIAIGSEMDQLGYFSICRWPDAWIVSISDVDSFHGATARAAIDAALARAGKGEE